MVNNREEEKEEVAKRNGMTFPVNGYRNAIRRYCFSFYQQSKRRQPFTVFRVGFINTRERVYQTINNEAHQGRIQGAEGAEAPLKNFKKTTNFSSKSVVFIDSTSTEANNTF